MFTMPNDYGNTNTDYLIRHKIKEEDFRKRVERVLN